MTNSISAANLTEALAVLRRCHARLSGGYVDAVDAAAHLTGARATRAGELADKVADALTHCERLIVVVTGDLHTEQA
jgi:hypothetical protein